MWSEVKELSKKKGEEVFDTTFSTELKVPGGNFQIYFRRVELAKDGAVTVKTPSELLYQSMPNYAVQKENFDFVEEAKLKVLDLVRDMRNELNDTIEDLVEDLSRLI